MSLFDVIRPRVCEIGKIKIGRKSSQERKSASGGTWRAPEKLDHFVVTTMNRDKNGDYLPDATLMESLSEFQDADGKLRELPVMVLSNDAEEILQSRYEWYVGKRIAAWSDGVTLYKKYDGKTWHEAPVESEWDPEKAKAKDSKGNRYFKLHTTLRVVIAAPKARWGGHYLFRTTSDISAQQLLGSLTHIASLTGGILRGLPLRLVVRPMQVSPDGKTTTVFVVHLDLLGPDLTAIQKQALERARFELENRHQLQKAQVEYRKLLAIAAHEPPADQADIAEEFHPESVDPEPPEQPDPLAAELGIQAVPPEVPDAEGSAPDDGEPDDRPPHDSGDPEADPFSADGSLFGDEQDQKARHEATR